MKNNNYLDLSGRTLKLFLTVLEEGSVTKAAELLGVGQSAVSHMLDKLRDITDDELFVRAGRGIVPTAYALELAQKVRPLLSDLQGLPVKPAFVPADLSGTLTIGASDMQREVLIPHLAKMLRQEAPNLDLRITNAGTFSEEALRKGRCDLVITPEPPDGTEFMQQKLFAQEWVVFYDPETPAPKTMKQYVARPHAKVIFSNNEHGDIDDYLAKNGQTRRVSLRVESFSALASLMMQTDIIVTLPRIIERSFLSEFACCKLPFELEPKGFYMGWHISTNASPYHQWLRAYLRSLAKSLNI